VELYRQGLTCGGGNEKSPSKCYTLKGFVGQAGLECCPLIMSAFFAIYYPFEKIGSFKLFSTLTVIYVILSLKLTVHFM
jgi:hypothetical protein